MLGGKGISLNIDSGKDRANNANICMVHGKCSARASDGIHIQSDFLEYIFEAVLQLIMITEHIINSPFFGNG